MSNKEDTKWVKGQSGNPRGRPRGTGRPISPLRSTLNKLKGSEAESADIIARVIDGDEEVSNKQADMAKWLISMLVTMTRGAIAEEDHRTKLQEDNRESQGAAEEKANGTTGRPKRLSLTILDEDE